MPLMSGKSKKAFNHNVEAEMNSGKPKDQSLAIAYSVKNKNKRKKMAKGGMANQSAASEQRPMPSERDNDAASISRNSANKPPHNDSWSFRSQDASKPSKMPLKHPKMVPQSLYTVRLRDEEDHLQESARVNEGPQEQPPKRLDEERANRQGPKVSDMENEHSTSRKPYAKGGKVEESDYRAAPNKYEDDLLDIPPSEDEGDQYAMDHNEIDPDRDGPESVDLHMKRMANGGMLDEEMEMEHEDSLAAAIMARKERQMRLDSDSDEDEMVMAADGGILSHDSIYSDDSDQADLSRNADEDANEEDQLSFNALRKENYSESEGLDQLDSPMDSNLHGDEREEDAENIHDRVSRIMSRMNMKRQFKQR